MNVLREPLSSTSTKRPLRPHIHTHIPALPNGSQDAPCVRCCTGYRCIAIDGADAEKVQSRVVGCDENGKRVLVVGILVRWA